MVVFDKGVPKNSEYRRFKIKTVEGANDFAMLQEVLRRRFKRAQKTGEARDAAPPTRSPASGRGRYPRPLPGRGRGGERAATRLPGPPKRPARGGG